MRIIVRKCTRCDSNIGYFDFIPHGEGLAIDHDGEKLFLCPDCMEIMWTVIVHFATRQIDFRLNAPSIE